jgi:hypothetical protein
MRTARNILLAGAAAVAVAGSGGLALAKDPAFHTMTVQLPDGGAARIQYAGNVTPKVTFEAAPSAADFFAPVSPFAVFDQISAQMDGMMNVLMREAETMAAPLWNPNQMFAAGLRDVPPGTMQYSAVSMMSGNGNVCTRTMEITSAGKGERPKVVSHTSGNCDAVGSATFGDWPSVAPPDSGGQTMQVDAQQGDRHAVPTIQDAAYRFVR